jgi:acetolactate synthase-1/2/3 large subunit
MLKTEIAQAERPLLLLGGSGWSDESAAAITRFAEANKIPVTTSFRRQDIVNNLSPVYAGDFGTSTAPSLYAHQRDADLLVVIGARLGEMTTKTYTTMQSPNPETRLVHLYPEADEIGRVYSPDLGIAAAPVSVAAALDGVDLGRADTWNDWCEKLHANYLTDTEAPNGGEWDLDMGVALAQLRDELPDDVVVTLDAGNHTGWAQRFLRFGRPGRIVGSTCDAMGYSVPAAVAASHGARAVLGRSAGKTDTRSQWINRMRERRHPNVVAVALANKNARIVWSLLSNDQEYSRGHMV